MFEIVVINQFKKIFSKPVHQIGNISHHYLDFPIYHSKQCFIFNEKLKRSISINALR